MHMKLSELVCAYLTAHKIIFKCMCVGIFLSLFPKISAAMWISLDTSGYILRYCLSFGLGMGWEWARNGLELAGNELGMS